MKRLALHITNDTVKHSEWPYSGIMVFCAQCGHRCCDKSPIMRKVYEPMIYRCARCRIDWLVEDTTDYRER